MKSFLTPFPESEDDLNLYYALQEADLPCLVKRHLLDTKLIEVEFKDLPTREPERRDMISTIKGFILGWVSCYYRDSLADPPDFQHPPGQLDLRTRQKGT